MQFKWRNILIIVGLFLAMFLLVDFNRRMEALDRLSGQLNTVSANATEVIQTQTAIAGRIAYSTSEAAVEEWAYGNKMVRPGEHPVVIVPDPNVNPTPVPALITQVDQQPNWRIWWELFFGARP
jgi:hypothetical protein